MHDSTDLPVPERTDIRGDSATLFVSLELSRSTWVATSLAPGSKKMSKHTLVGGDGRKLLDLLARLKTRAEQRIAAPVKVVGDPRSRARWFLDSSLARGQRRREPRRRSCVDCRASTPPARQDRCDRRRDAAAHADGLAARRAAGLCHDSAAKPERRGLPSGLARARDAAAGAHSAHEPHPRTAVWPGDHQL